MTLKMLKCDKKGKVLVIEKKVEIYLSYWAFREQKLKNKHPHQGYRDLAQILSMLDAKVGVFTTNVDSFFVQTLGKYGPVSEFHGAMRLGFYDHQFRTGTKRKPEPILVKRPHIVTFGENIEDFRGMGKWDELMEAKVKFEALENEAKGKVVILEIGVSSEVDSAPDKIESLLEMENADVKLIRITKGKDKGSKKNPKNKAENLIEFREGARKALKEIKETLDGMKNSRKRKLGEPEVANKKQKQKKD